MKKVLLFCILALLVPMRAFATDALVEKATKLFKENHFRDAAELRSVLPSIDPSALGAAYLSLGIIYLSNADLYERLYDLSVVVHHDYLMRLSSLKGKDSSRAVNLYLSQIFLAEGKPKEAAFHFVKVSQDKRLDPHLREIAKTDLGLTFYLRGEKQKAAKIWAGIAKTGDPELLSELAVSYSKAGLENKNPESICFRALTNMQKAGGQQSVRVANNCIGVFAGHGRVEEALNMLAFLEDKDFTYEETLDENKIIRFYDVSLLENLSSLYRSASIEYLKKAMKDTKSKDIAHYYLGRAYGAVGKFDESSNVLRSFVGSSKSSSMYKSIAEIRQTEADYGTGKKKEALQALKAYSRKYQSKPYLLSEVVFVCEELKTDCKEIINDALKAASRGEGKTFSRLNFALGTYHLDGQQYEKAIVLMEQARDKSHKNRIEFNDPLLLAGLAKAYFMTKKYSEALEILFEMSKQFPAVRQIQVALQGVYSMEQKSAGDVKVQ